MRNVIVLQEHTPGTPLYTPSRWYTPGKFWYTLGCTIHPVDKHWAKAFCEHTFALHHQKPKKNRQNVDVATAWKNFCGRPWC